MVVERPGVERPGDNVVDPLLLCLVVEPNGDRMGLAAEAVWGRTLELVLLLCNDGVEGEAPAVMGR